MGSVSDYFYVSERAEPVGKFIVNRFFEPEGFVVSPTVFAGRIDMQRGRYFVPKQSGVVPKAVFGRNRRVVAREGDKCSRALVGDMVLVGIIVDKLRVGLVSDKVLP